MKYFTIIILAVLSLFYLGLNTDESLVTFADLRMMGCFGVFQFAFSIYSSLKTGQKLISPYLLFLLALYVFSYGQSLLYGFDIVGSRDLWEEKAIPVWLLYRSQRITLIFLACFQIGALLSKGNLRMTTYPLKVSDYENDRLKKAGWVLFIISVYPYYKELMTNMIISLTLGYSAVYAQESHIGLSNISGVISEFYLPSLICLFISYRAYKKWRISFIMLFAFSCVVLLITGGRSEAVIIGALVLILYNYLVKQFSKKNLIIIGVCVVGFLYLSAAIAANRGNQQRDLAEMTQRDSDTNGAIEAISEMGGTMFCLIKTDQLMNEGVDYKYGSSYTLSLTSLIPNLGFWDIHPAKKGANLSDWLTDELNLDYGTGYSMVAEAYINFGYYGAFMMMLLGYLINYFFGNLGVAIRSRHIAFVAFIFVVFWFSLKMPRNSFIGIVRGVFYYALPIFWYARGFIVAKEDDRYKSQIKGSFKN